MPERDLALLTDAARKAGEIAMRFWKKTPQVWDKGGGNDPVTEADIAVNDMLARTLRAARPDYGWLSEETEDNTARTDAEHLFVIDPIDGTRAFIAGEESFAHSLAVAHRGKVTAAVVYLPALDRLYTACDHGPALLDGEPILASHRDALAGATLLTSRAGLAPEHWPGGVPDVHRVFRTSLAYRLCLVAEGRYDAMLTLRDTWEWDVAAGTLIAERAGAVVSDRTGARLSFNARHPQLAGVIAAGPAVHGALLDKLGVGVG